MGRVGNGRGNGAVVGHPDALVGGAEDQEGHEGGDDEGEPALAGGQAVGPSVIGANS